MILAALRVADLRFGNPVQLIASRQARAVARRADNLWGFFPRFTRPILAAFPMAALRVNPPMSCAAIRQTINPARQVSSEARCAPPPLPVGIELMPSSRAYS